MQSVRRSYQLTSRLRNGGQRAFSKSSTQQRRALPQFHEPSTPELTTLLSNLNRRILLPEHLNKTQRDLVYKQENKQKLEAEPIEITIGDVTLPLEHLDRNRDIPERAQTVKDIVGQSKTAEDWQNVVRMMEGLNDAGLPLPHRWAEMIVRKMDQAGMHNLIINALKRSKRTNLKLWQQNLGVKVFAAWRNLARTGGEERWDVEAVEKALRFAEQTIELIDDNEEAGMSKRLAEKKNSWEINRSQHNPMLIAVPLELAAIRARKTDGQDTDGKVLKYARRTVAAMMQNDWEKVVLDHKLNTLHKEPANHEKQWHRARELNHMRDTVKAVEPLWNGLRLGRLVLGDAMPEAQVAKAAEDKMYAALTKADETFAAARRDGFIPPARPDAMSLKELEQL